MLKINKVSMNWGRLIFFILMLMSGHVLNAQVNVLEIEQIDYHNGLPYNSVQSIKQDKYGFIWLSSFVGLSRFDGYQFTDYLPEPENSKTIFTKSVYNMMLDTAQNLWIAFFDSSKYCMYNYKTNDFIRYSSLEVPKYIKDLSNRKNLKSNIAENNSEIWELKNSKLFCTDKLTGKVKQYFMRFPQNEHFEESRVRVMFIDTFGTLWIGTEGKGVFKVNIYTKPFLTFSYNLNGEPRIIDNIIRAIFEDKKQNLYFGTQYEGVFVLNRLNNSLSRIGGPEKPDYQRLRDNQIRCLLEDHLGHIWIGTKGGVGEYFPETGRIRNYNRFGKVNVPHNWVFTVTEDHDGNIWVGTLGEGIARYDRENDRFIRINPLKTLNNSRVYCMITDRNNNLWVGTHGGGVTCLKRTDSIDVFNSIHYLNEPGNSKSISSNRIFCLFEDSKGNIWTATDYGLNCIDPVTRQIKKYFHKDGLSDDIVFSITEDKNGNIWMANQKGISKLDVKSVNLNHYNEKDGLVGNEMSENAVFNNPRTGELIFGSIRGMVSFFPNQIINNRILPKVVLTSLEVLNQIVVPGEPINNHIILNEHISLANKIVLDYSDKSFSIEFSALHYTNPMANKYEYMLENYDDHWIQTSASRRFATYSNLPAGKYNFKVRASNDDGIWSPVERKLSITVKSPWWFSIWAFIAYIFIIGLISYFFVLYVVARMRMKNEVRYEKMKARKVLELNQMKEQFFTKISHELRTPLSLLLDPLRKLNARMIDNADLGYYYSIMYQNAQRLTKLVNELLDFRKIESNEFTLNTSRGDLIPFLSHIINAFRISNTDQNIQLNFSSDYQSIDANFDGDVLEKIVFNLISNAIKYNKPNGRVDFTVSLLNVDEKGRVPVKIEIADTGIGISPESVNKIFELYYQEKLTDGMHRVGTGIGLSLTRELVLLQEGTINVNSELGKGSTFTVILPIATGEVIEAGDQAPVVIQTESFVVPEPELNGLPKNKEKTEHYKILIVEDNNDVRTYIRKDLEMVFEVIEASNGLEGWRKVNECLPDLILSDLMMPEMNGYELCHKIKSDKRTSHIPVIVLTSLTSEKAAIEAIENGADAFVSKPFSSALLRARIINLIDSRKSLIDHFGNQPLIDVKKIAGNSLDETFMNKAIEFVEKYISEPEFNIDLLADNMNLSRRHLSHKIKMLTGQTVNEFVKSVRLRKGAEMMLNTDYTISEIAYRLGYNAPANFSRSFSKQFGKTPTEYLESIVEK